MWEWEYVKKEKKKFWGWKGERKSCGGSTKEQYEGNLLSHSKIKLTRAAKKRAHEEEIEWKGQHFFHSSTLSLLLRLTLYLNLLYTQQCIKSEKKSIWTLHTCLNFAMASDVMKSPFWNFVTKHITWYWLWPRSSSPSTRAFNTWASYVCHQ